jgi:hypothetical protein
MNTNKPKNSYDDTKKMLNVIRNIQSSTKPQYGLIDEQTDELTPQPQPEQPQPEQPVAPESGGEEGSDYAIINDVEVVIHSEDPEDLELNDEEKGQISQLIDDFRVEVVETAQFDKLDIYETSAKLGGKIGEIGLMFTLSTGDDTGLYINGQMLKIDENSIMILEKLGAFQLKFSSAINDLLVRRRTT